ncbi:DUF188 domain-containing protein [Peptoniphilus asaccharolyticus]
MKIYLDADGSPITSQLINIAKEYQIELIIVKNYLTNIQSDYATIVSVDISSDSADLYIANHVSHGDLAITADRALSALILAKGCNVIDFYGTHITDDNILFHLDTRHTNRNLRKKGIYSKNTSRKSSDNQIFIDSVKNFLEACLNN